MEELEHDLELVDVPELEDDLDLATWTHVASLGQPDLESF